MRILVVDDDRKLCDVIKRGLKEESHAVDCVYNGGDGEYYAENTPYDLIILDIMLPEKNGLDVCKSLRIKNINTSILMLTAKDTVEDRVKGLDTGADDYLVKPFSFDELVARIRSLGRRRYDRASPIIKVGPVTLGNLTISNEVVYCASQGSVTVQGSVQITGTGALVVITPNTTMETGFEVNPGGMLFVYSEALP